MAALAHRMQEREHVKEKGEEKARSFLNHIRTSIGQGQHS
jgi:hypothetical protein